MASLVQKVETRGGFIAQRLSLDVLAELKIAAAPHHKTGQMEASIRTTWFRVAPTRWRVEASVPVIQAATTNFGARPHMIYPKTKKALAFNTKGGRVVVRSVSHPGNRAFHWFSDVMSMARIETLLSRFVGRP